MGESSCGWRKAVMNIRAQPASSPHDVRSSSYSGIRHLRSRVGSHAGRVSSGSRGAGGEDKAAGLGLEPLRVGTGANARAATC